MRPAAEVEPFALLINRDGLALGQVLNQLGFKLLAHFAEQLDRRVAVHDFALKFIIAVDDEGHLLFNRGEVIGRERLVPVEVIIEPVFNNGADCNLRAGEKLLHGFRQNMGRIMTDQFQPFWVFGCDEFDFRIRLNRQRRINQLSVQLGR